MNYLAEVNLANIAPSNFEVVDESSLMISSSSGEANTNREIVTYTASTGSASTDVVLVGVTLGLPEDVLYFQAGSPAVQLSAFVGGTANTNVTWTMSPALGTLTSSGLYTPPTTSASLQSTTITATSVANSSVASQMTLWVMPNGTIRVVPGQGSNYTDSHGNVWLAGEGGGGDAGCDLAMPCFGYDNGGSWPSTPDITLYKRDIYAGNDLRYDIHVANGTYQINMKASNNGPSGLDMGAFIIEPQGVAGSPINILSLVGNNEPYDYTTNVTVTTGLLSFVLRRINTTGPYAPFISGLQIIQTATN